MADDLITIQLRLTGGTAAAAEARKVSGAVGGIGDTTASSMDKATKPTSKFRSTLSSLGRTMAFATIPVVGALGYEVARSVNAFREARKIGQQTNAVIQSTGGVANITAQEVQRLADTLSLKTGVDDEEIQSGANMLLTFKNLRNEVGRGNNIFDRSVEVINDMSSALGRDLKSSAIQVGKALNDPAVGLTALSRSGVTFTEQQKEQIKTLFASGRQLKAQKIILHELTSEFGGSAKAQHDAIDRLGVAWENLEEKLGEALYPVLRTVTNWLTKALRQAQKGRGPLIDLKNVVVDVAGGVKTFVGVLDWVVDRLGNFADIVIAVNKPLYESLRLVTRLDDILGSREVGGDFAIGGVGGAFEGIASGGASNPQSGHGGQSHPGAQGKLPALVAPPRRGGGGGKRDLTINVPVFLDRKKIGQATAKAALEAGARA